MLRTHCACPQLMLCTALLTVPGDRMLPQITGKSPGGATLGGILSPAVNREGSLQSKVLQLSGVDFLHVDWQQSPPTRRVTKATMMSDVLKAVWSKQALCTHHQCFQPQ
jgi:hypothetical protein